MKVKVVKVKVKAKVRVKVCFFCLYFAFDLSLVVLTCSLFGFLSVQLVS